MVSYYLLAMFSQSYGQFLKSFFFFKWEVSVVQVFFTILFTINI